MAATGGQGVDLVVDPIGGEAFDDAIRVLAPEGRLLVDRFRRGRWDPDRQGEPAAAAQRQRGRRRLGRVRAPPPGRPGGGRSRTRRSWWPPGCARRHRCGFRCPRARLRSMRWPTVGCAGSSSWSHEVRALAFDVFGTVVDWRSSIIGELEASAKARTATGLAGLRRQLAGRLRPGDGPGAPR